MRNLRIVIPCLLLTLLLIGCQEDPLVQPEVNLAGSELGSAWVDPELAAQEIMTVTKFPYDSELVLPERLTTSDKALLNLVNWEREDLGDDVIHYAFTIRVGCGGYDQIVLHRVVKEGSPCRPHRSTKNIFLLHGDGVGFVKFLYGPAAPSAPDDHAAAIYLAKNGVDVWGMDQNWVLVPPETADFEFMNEWGLDNQVENLRTAMAIARFVRMFSGNGFGTMNLLGYSSGGVTGYACLNDEAARPEYQRHVGGYVCADMFYKYGPELDANRQIICADSHYQGSRLAAGEYADPIPFVPLGELASGDPDGDSPIIPGMTNLQVALYFTAATFDLSPFHPTWHYFGGTFDPETGLPVDLNFTSIDGMTDFMKTACAWEALRFIYDYEVLLCNEEDVPWDDNLAAVEVPILLLEPAGGLADAASYTLGLLGSTDVQIATASLMPPERATEDFGHVDIWTAPQAEALVWQPMLKWIEDHSDGGGRCPYALNEN